MTGRLRVSVIIPARNEEADIERCLEHVLRQDHPHEDLEVIVIDGASTDHTGAIARAFLSGSDVGWHVIENLTATTPSNLNRGLEVASGDVICRVDARSFIPPHYVRTCARQLAAYPDRVVVGGAQVASAAGDGVVERGIARALNNRLVMGGARYRSGAESGPDDTVYLGAFRTDEVRRAGGWDERLETNQDFELNQRMARFGLVWFDCGIPVDYRPRGSLTELFSQYWRFGVSKGTSWRSGTTPVRRQTRLLGGAVTATLGALIFVFSGSSAVRRVALLAGIGGIGGFVIDHVGNARPATVAERTASVASTACIVSGWLSGVASGMARRQRES